MLTIFHRPRTRSIRVVWLLEEMGVPYETVSASLGEPSAEVLALNPSGSLPVLVDGEVVLTESLVMLDYVARTYGPTPLALQPDDAGYWTYRDLLVFGEASLTMGLGAVVMTAFMAPDEAAKDNFTRAAIRDRLAVKLKAVSRRLEAGPYMMGEAFTIADISMDYLINLSLGIPQLGLANLLKPDVLAYHERLSARPAFQRMIKVK